MSIAFANIEQLDCFSVHDNGCFRRNLEAKKESRTPLAASVGARD
jgi:hypothetical protein